MPRLDMGATATANLLALDAAHGVRFVAGCDEAGRGCIAGPLVAAAVLLDLGTIDRLRKTIGEVNDSKRLTAARRNALYGPILANAKVAVVSRSAASIDQRGIQWANLNALSESLERVSGHLDGDVIRLVDGFQLDGCDLPHKRLVRGDASSAAIAAASIIAKETRDRLMRRMHQRWPQYGFDRHCGYPTVAHKAAIAEHGACPAHRVSFAGVS